MNENESIEFKENYTEKVYKEMQVYQLQEILTYNLFL